MLVKDHLELLCSQFLASSMRVSHPSHGIVCALPERRSRLQPTRDFTPKLTLHALFKEKVEPFFVNNVLPEASYKRTIKSYIECSSPAY